MEKEVNLKEYGKAVSKFVKSVLKSNVLLNDKVPSVSSSHQVVFEGNVYLSETKVIKIKDKGDKLAQEKVQRG